MVLLIRKRYPFQPEATPQTSAVDLGGYMKKKITVKSFNGQLYFYLQSDQGEHFLFTQKFTGGVYRYFRNGISENQLREYRRWDRNPRLDKTIEKLPTYITYVMRECV